MGGPGSGPKRKPKKSEPWTSDTLAAAELRINAEKIDLGQLLQSAVIAATEDPEILHSLQILLSPHDRSYLVDIGESREKVSVEKLEAIVATDALQDFVQGLLERATRKWNRKRDYTRTDLLTSVAFALTEILQGAVVDADSIASAMGEATAKEFGLTGVSDLYSTPGQIAYLNHMLRKAILERIAESNPS